MAMSPTVLCPLTLAGLLRLLLAPRAGTAATATTLTLIVCASRDAFLQQLAQSLQHEQHATDTDTHAEDVARPSLHNLLRCRHVQLAFCASVQALLAHLTVYGHGQASASTLVLVNPLALHASTPSFSAQGLSRSFAAATETARRTGAALHVVECPGPAAMTEDPWEQQLSILNGSARRFGAGSGGERAWAGRTVTAKTIAARWFRFQEANQAPSP
ncbi:hypothetical protein ACEQ8H_004230 [Pleosporales sp. CAS-2024a]